MRANKVMNYTSILQVLGEPGCPFCRFMKAVQVAALQTPGRTEIHHLCNFHTWGFAATQRAPFAAQLFLTLLQEGFQYSRNLPCDICILLWEEEDRRVREFISCLNHKLVTQWLRSQATLCLVHGAKLAQGAPPVLASTIQIVMERYRRQLAGDLEKLRDEYRSDTANWGLLGHAAEFLVSQRGLHI
jgi:hypothetical protein